jgi:hypothetical protein
MPDATFDKASASEDGVNFLEDATASMSAAEKARPATLSSTTRLDLPPTLGLNDAIFL